MFILDKRKRNLESNKRGFFDPKVIVLTLEFRKDRQAFIENELRRNYINFEYFYGLHGKTEIDQVYRVISFGRYAKQYLSSGSKGCIASHIQIWQKIANQKSEITIIFEDDVSIEASFSTIIDRLQNAPKDADLIYLGSGSKMSCINMTKVGNGIYRPFAIRNGAFGYAITKKGALKLLKLTTNINLTCGGIDSWLGVLTMRRQITAYHLLPSLCQVNYLFESNIIDQFKRRKVIHPTELI